MSSGIDHAGAKEYNSSVPVGDTRGDISIEEHQTAKAAARFGYGPLAHPNRDNEARLPAFGGEFQPGLYKDVKERTLGNPAPLGLSAFALTAFVLSLINMNTRDVAVPNIVVSLAFGYGGLVQLLAGMWYVCSSPAGTPTPAVCFQRSLVLISVSIQGVCCGEYVCRNRSLLLWRVLALLRRSLHPRWFRNRVDYSEHPEYRCIL